MPSPKFIPFSNDRFNARAGERDVVTREPTTFDGDGIQEGHGVRREPPWHPPIAHSETRPTSVAQALMEARPGVEPERSVEEDFLTREWIDYLLNGCDERQRYVIEALFYEGQSLRELGRRMSLSKDQVANIRNAALAAMRKEWESWMTSSSD